MKSVTMTTTLGSIFACRTTSVRNGAKGVASEVTVSISNRIERSEVGAQRKSRTIDESPYETVAVDSVTVELKDIRAELDVLGQIDLDNDNVMGLVDEAVDLLDTTKSVIETNGDSLALYEDWIDFHEKYEKHDTAFGRKVAEQWGEQPSRDGNPVVLSVLDTVPYVETVIEDAVTNERALSPNSGNQRRPETSS